MKTTKGDSLGDRMKGYERAFLYELPRRMPVVIRLDGKAFHTLTRHLKRPFDENLVDLMNRTMQYVCEQIGGAELGYVQSDEISILLHNYRRLNSQPWFNNEVQKLVSVTAAMAASYFTLHSGEVFGDLRLVAFDARVFVLPQAEVCNYFIWRQQDCTRNSVQMLARSMYSHGECTRKNNSQLQEMIHEKGLNWNKLPTGYKRGRCVRRAPSGERRDWLPIDNDIPVFSKEREYINDLLKVDEE